MKADRFKVCALLVFVMALLPCVAVHAEAMEVLVSAPTRLQTLERKAGEYESYRAQYFEIQTVLDGMLALLPTEEEGDAPTPKAGYGMLADLLEKAAQADVLARELDEALEENERMRRQLIESKAQLNTLQAKCVTEAETIARNKAESQKWKKTAEGLRETIDRLLLGEFEFYEVKEGDSLQSIAANPMVYGDPTRAAWLRRVNDGRVKQVDCPVPGDVLIVPRFPRNGSYEF